MVERISNLMMSRLSLASMGRTNSALFDVQQQLSSGKAINRTSDDVVKSAAISLLDDRLARSDQVQRNVQHADSALSQVESALGESNSLALSAKSIASAQLGATSSASERAGQVNVVDGLIRGLVNIANQQGSAGYILGGSATSTSPLRVFGNGYQYRGTGNGLLTDLGQAQSVPLTLGSNNPILGTSAPIRSITDLDPVLTASTRLTDLTGARGTGITAGPIEVSINGGPRTAINLAGADSLEDVRVRIESVLRTYETDSGTTVLGPGGVSFSGGSLSFDLSTASTATPTLRFSDIGTATSAMDLGLASQPAADLTLASPLGADLAPKLTWRTPISALAGITAPLGTLRIANAGKTCLVDLSGATTLEDIRNSIAGADAGVRVQISSDGSAIEIVNDVAAPSSQALSISEVAGGTTATQLGIRTLAADTRLNSFNFGKGVSIVDVVNNPATGLPDPNLSSDFAITLGDTARTQITIDLRPQDMTSVQTLLDRINSQAATQLAAAGLPPTAFSAGLAADGNGIAFAQTSTFPSPLSVAPRNNSPAADQLGLLTGAYDPASGTLIGTDRSKVRVESLFTSLLDLREGLATNNVSGITLAGESVDSRINDIAEFRGVIGGHAQQLDATGQRESERSLLNTTLRSSLADVDYTEAATRFSLLQTQLTASLRTTALASQTSLLDYLG